MTRSSAVAGLGCEFDDFLFAPIGAQKNGMVLSVVSALTRLDIDPWQEAGKLAHLPVAAATQRLIALIAQLPDWSLAQADTGTIAARLIALLPSRTISSHSSREPSHDPATKPRFSFGVQAMIYVIVMVIAFALGMQLITMSPEPPPQIDQPNVRAVPPPLSPPIASK